MRSITAKLKKLQIKSLPQMDKPERVKRLKEHLALTKINHEEQILKQPSLKDAHTYCVIYGVSAQQFGPLLEKYILHTFNFTKNKAEHCIGDCCKDGVNTEIKVSLGGSTHTKFNYVQIRPSHDCDNYLLTAYHLTPENVESEGELYIFRVPKKDMLVLLSSYGGYAHGTNKEHGKISATSFDHTKEYALRPAYNDKCWQALLPFRISEAALAV